MLCLPALCGSVRVVRRLLVGLMVACLSVLERAGCWLWPPPNLLSPGPFGFADVLQTRATGTMISLILSNRALARARLN